MNLNIFLPIEGLVVGIILFHRSEANDFAKIIHFVLGIAYGNNLVELFTIWILFFIFVRKRPHLVLRPPSLVVNYPKQIKKR